MPHVPAQEEQQPEQQQVLPSSNGPPAKAARLVSPTGSSVKAALDRPRSGSSAGVRRDGVPVRLSVFARLPPSCPFVGNFHYAPSAGNRAYSFFEGQIVPYRETERLHKIKTNPLTGNFHSRPGHYSRLHGLQNFRKNVDRVATGDAGMRVIIARIKTSLMEPSSSAVAEATAEDVSIHACTARSPALTRSGVKQRPGSLARTAPEFHTPLSASDASLLASASTGSAHSHLNAKSKNSARRREYSKYWDDADTERGRFGSSVDDNAVGSSAPGAAADDAAMVEAAMAAGVRGLGKGGVHWGKHHHHHGAGSDEGMSEPLIGDATLKLRHLYFQRKHMRPNLVSEGPKSPAAGAHRGSRGGLGGRGKAVVKGGPVLTTRRSAPTLTEGRGRGRGRRQGTEVGVSAPARRSSFAGQGWESHTLQAQQKTDEYMQGREDLAPGMRPAVVLDNEVSLAYDVDLSEAGVLGAGAYGTVLAAVHRSTGRQVAIKTMLKKYLFSDAEKASVEREIEIQQRLMNNHIIRLYEIYQSPEKLYIVLERAPCGSLEEFLYVRGRMSELDAKRLVRQLLEGVAYLHKVGVVHCDLKPANVLFSDIDQGEDALADGGGSRGRNGDKRVIPRAQASTPPSSLKGLVVKICDFGHTRKVPDCRYYKFTGDINKIPFHMFKHTGTEGFVAPEVLVQEPYGKAADMWSTGCMLHKMLTGRMPWIPARKCLQIPLSTTGPTWKGISEEAISLVKDLLNTDQTFRANVDEATHHPWFDGMDHCALMPTTAPGGNIGKGSPDGAIPMLVNSPRAEGDIAAGRVRVTSKTGAVAHQDEQEGPKTREDLPHLTASGRKPAARASESLKGTGWSVQVA